MILPAHQNLPKQMTRASCQNMIVLPKQHCNAKTEMVYQNMILLAKQNFPKTNIWQECHAKNDCLTKTVLSCQNRNGSPKHGMMPQNNSVKNQLLWMLLESNLPTKNLPVNKNQRFNWATKGTVKQLGTSLKTRKTASRRQSAQLGNVSFVEMNRHNKVQWCHYWFS